MGLHQYEKLVLRALLSKRDIPSISSSTGIGADGVRRALGWLREKGLVEMGEKWKETFSLSEEGKRYLSAGFPETRVMRKAAENAAISSLSDDEKRIGLPWAKRNGWIEIAEGKLIPTDKGKTALEERALESACALIEEGKKVDEQMLSALIKRGLVSGNKEKSVSPSLTKEGRKEAEGIPEKEGNEINVLTKELIVTKKWKEGNIRPYNIRAETEPFFPGKRHVLKRAIEKVRDIFTQMGFEEMEGPIIESSFWNFDALFQPQDHPARELADTFYLKGSAPLPDRALVERVKRAHEKGWRYKWDENEAKKLVLRTHTTAVSARYLSKCKDKKPHLYFCVGRTYRNEAVDFSHLAEFYQVEGIVVWENATFRDLLGYLKEFYSRLGFERIRFRPSYFPYTEPSLEVEVYYEKKKEWMELGGAGILRPEVSIPLCNRYPVLAWGLSLERPLMLALGIDDIRTFYKNNVGWLRKTKASL
jgi:phenylalanyl-tRNA synthetase alpha chain